MRWGDPGSIPGADNLDSWFHPFGVGKMSSSQYVVGSRYRRLRLWIVRPWDGHVWLMQPEAQNITSFVLPRLARAISKEIVTFTLCETNKRWMVWPITTKIILKIEPGQNLFQLHHAHWWPIYKDSMAMAGVKLWETLRSTQQTCAKNRIQTALINTQFL